MTSLGGDAFWLIHDARTGAVRSLEAAGRAAAAATIDWFAARGLREIPIRGIVPATLTVPGAVDGWCEAHAAHGRLPLAADLAAAVGYARDGFPVTQRLAQWIDTLGRRARGGSGGRAHLPGRRAEPAGGLAPAQSGSRAHARARRRDGRAGFYEGRDRARRWRGTRASTAASSPSATSPRSARSGASSIQATYRGVTIHETPPPSQGVSVLQTLRLLEPWEIGALPFLGPDHVHLLVQAKQIAFHDRDRLVADPEFVAGARRAAAVDARTRTSAGSSWTGSARCPGTASRPAAA